MYNANAILKTFYYTSLKNVLAVPVFKNYVPNELKADAYVLISNIQNTDASTINKNNYKAFVTIGIYTRTIVENNGITCDSIADDIFSIYPTPQSYPQIEGYQVGSVNKESDNELTVSLDSGNVYINRQIIFSHILNKLN
jgi:hypothetical protein